MVFAEFSSVFSGIPQLFSRNDDDVYDRLNHRWTTALLLFAALIVSATQYVGTPVHCWTPAHFSGGWNRYTNQYCWIRNTYYIPWEDEIHKDLDRRYENTLVYYQWLPLIFMVQALFFYLPIVAWRVLNSQTGMDMNDVIETCEKYQDTRDLAYKDKLLGFITKQTHRYITESKTLDQQTGSLAYVIKNLVCCCWCGRRFGNYITLIYVLIKLTFIANILGQMFLLDSVLGMNFSSYGLDVMRAAANNQDWTDNERFPRVTYCDLDVRRLGNENRYTVQCVLTINLFTEKIYLLLWFWFVFLAFITIIGLIMLVLRSVFAVDQVRYIGKHLTYGCDSDLYNPHNPKDKERLDDFVRNYLKRDGVLTMRLIGHNTSKMVVVDLICSLWENYKNDELQSVTDSKPSCPSLDQVDTTPLKKMPLA